MNNKGVELAINQVVMMIIGIVILGLGLAFVGKIISTSEQQLEGVDARMVRQLEEALDSGAVVQIPLNIQTSSAKDMSMFNLGILNDPVVSNNITFYIDLRTKGFVPRKGPGQNDQNNNDMFVLPPGFIETDEIATLEIEIPENGSNFIWCNSFKWKLSRSWSISICSKCL